MSFIYEILSSVIIDGSTAGNIVMDTFAGEVKAQMENITDLLFVINNTEIDDVDKLIIIREHINGILSNDYDFVLPIHEVMMLIKSANKKFYNKYRLLLSDT